jgi:chorismate mutase
MIHRTHAWALLLGVSVFLVAGCGVRSKVSPPPPPQQSAPPPAVDRLLHLIADRLRLMHDVARSKWNAGRPIADPGREQALLGDMEERSQAYGLDPVSTRAFFEAQVEAAKIVQEADTRRWRAEDRGQFKDPPDLSELRRRIDQLNRDLLAALADAQPFLRAEAGRGSLPAWAEEIIADNGIPDDARTAAIAPLRKVGPPP